ncbi:unnamed protein product [Trichobilharzia szidati]|nr:unnamed protein product [Trichobilharzia szidati]
MFTWGANSHGQLGTGDDKDVYEPQIINFSDPVTLLAGGGGHSLIVNDNMIMTSGSSSSDQMGRSDNCYFFKPTSFSFRLTVKLLTCGWDFSVAVLDDGSVFTWGSNAYGQLSREGIKSSTAPIRVDIEPVRSISAGLRHVICVTVSGKVMGWGSNRRKQLFPDKTLVKTDQHIGSSEIYYHPILLNSVLGDENDFVDCAAGAYHSMVKTKTNCLALWGYIRFFQLRSRVRNYSSNIKMVNSSIIWYDSELFDGGEIEQLVCGWSHVLARTSVGDVYSWGRSDFGQLGRIVEVPKVDESSASKVFPNFDGNPVKINFDSKNDHRVIIKNIACGSEHSLAVDSNGKLWVWGWDEHGMCGVGENSSQVEKHKTEHVGVPFISQPYLLKLKSFGRDYKVKHIACGYGHSMAYVEST